MILSLIILSYFNCQSYCQDILVTPKRIVYTDNVKMKQNLNLVNIGKDTVVYKISFLNYKMTTKGKFEEINEEDSLHNFAEQYLRVYPRKVILPPNEPQLISVQFRRNPNMIPGEYRSHLYLRSEINDIPLSDEKELTSKGLAIQIIPIYGISIPVIIKVDESSIDVEIAESILNKADDDYFVDVVLSRKGDFSFYGDIEISYLNNKNKTSVSRVNGIALYTDVNQRHLRMKLDKNADFDYDQGELTITLFSNDLKKRTEIDKKYIETP